MIRAILIALLNPCDLLSPKVGSEEWPSSQRHLIYIHDGRWFESGHFQNLLFIIIYRISTSGLTKTNKLCGTESAEWKGKLRVSLWAYLRGDTILLQQIKGQMGIPQDILDLVSNEYPDPRLIIYVESELKT